jgi:hypothetical protein
MNAVEGISVHESPLREWKKLSIFENGFRYGKQWYTYEDIDCLEFRCVATNVRVNFVPAGTDYEAHLKIILTGDRGTIKADYNGSITKWPLASAKLKAERVCAVYAEVAKRSFAHRMRRYVNDLKDHGYFMYDGAKFYPDGKVTSGKKEANLKVHEVRKNASQLEICVPGDGHWHWDSPSIDVELAKDPDCFTVLMRTVYGLSFTGS